jgi:hypothetical protein
MIFSYVSTFIVYILCAVFFNKPLGLTFIFDPKNIVVSGILVGIAWLPFYLFNIVYRKYFPETHERV